VLRFHYASPCFLHPDALQECSPGCDLKNLTNIMDKMSSTRLLTLFSINHNPVETVLNPVTDSVVDI
jgi:hypothetical protein